jgi:hypothetical protein
VRRNLLEAALWTASLASGAATIRELRSPGSNVAQVPVRAASVSVDMTPPDESEFVHAAELITASDLFRVQRHPAAVRFQVDTVAVSAQSPSLPATTLALAGIIGGPPWEALVEGLPNRDGATLVKRGDVFGSIKIVRVTRDSVVIVMPDSLRTFGLKRAWK